MRVIDSHTGGQPTRVIMEGGPNLGTGPLDQRLRRFASEFDAYRTRCVLEPRGCDSIVGALICEPNDPDCDAGAIFFNNRGYLGMCGHATIGLAVTLVNQRIWSIGTYRLETPVGVVDVEVLSPQQVSFENVESYVFQQDVRVEVPGIGEVVGDVAWGGNWFYLVRNSPIAVRVERIPDLTEVSLKIRAAIEAAGISGERGEEIDHIELFGPATVSGALAKNFVLCPGGAYDRSPCGTGTCAKMASLAARGRLRADEVWIQEGILGSVFSGQYRNGSDNRILPRLTGTAFVTGEALLEFSDEDPFRNGIVQ